MSTKKVSDTTQTTQFAPAGMSAYNTMTPEMQQVLSMYMSNPLTASYFQQQLGMANRSIGKSGQANMSTMLQNARQFGTGGNNAFLQSQIAKQGRATSGQQSDAFTQLLLGAEGNRRWAGGAAAGYSPLATGQTGHSTEKTSGLGTWLPQLAGAGLGFLTGGASSMFSSPFAQSGGFGHTPTSGSPFAGALSLQSSPNPGGSLVNPFMR